MEGHLSASNLLIAIISAAQLLQLFLFAHTWKKMDRMTALWFHEKDLLVKRMDGFNKDVTELTCRITEVQTRCEMRHKP